MPWTYIVTDLKGEEIVRTFYKKKLQKKKKKNKRNKKEFRVENGIKRKDNKLYVK